jgi:hypothetical protein
MKWIVWYGGRRIDLIEAELTYAEALNVAKCLIEVNKED